MRRAKMEGQHIGRRRANVDRLSLFERRRQGWSLGMLAQSYQISRTTVARIVQEEYAALKPENLCNPSPLNPNVILKLLSSSPCSLLARQSVGNFVVNPYAHLCLRHR